MSPGALVRIRLKDGKVAAEERYLGALGQRIRDVEQGPDGLLYLLADDDNGRIIRVSPKKIDRAEPLRPGSNAEPDPRPRT